MKSLVQTVTLAALALQVAAEKGISLAEAQLFVERAFQSRRAREMADAVAAAPPPVAGKSVALLARELQAQLGISITSAQQIATRMQRAGRTPVAGGGTGGQAA